MGENMAGRLHRRVWRVGGSLVVTVPGALVKELGLRAGELIGVTFTPVDVVLRAPDIAVRALAAVVSDLTPALMRLREFDGVDLPGSGGGEAWLSDLMR